MRLLLVEDDLQLSRGLERALSSEGYTVDAVNTGEAALFLVAERAPDIVVLDIGLPDMDGLKVLEGIRAKVPLMPVLLLTARGSVEDKVAGLDKGADDYLTKPFEMPELIARLRVFGRRAATSASNVIELGEIALDSSSHTVTKSGELLELSRREYMVLKALMENAGKVMSKHQLESRLYSWGEDVSSNTVEVHIHHLRKKLTRDFIKTIRGVGYTVNKS